MAQKTKYIKLQFYILDFPKSMVKLKLIKILKTMLQTQNHGVSYMGKVQRGPVRSINRERGATHAIITPRRDR